MEEELITDKQYYRIKKDLVAKYNIDLDDLKKLTKQEASRIIQTNIVRGCPLLQWYVWHEIGKNKLYANTCEYAENIMCNSFLDKIELKPKIFIKKRMADKYYGEVIERKSPTSWLFEQGSNIL